MHKYVITADIKRMYRQIRIAENQRNYQYILWRENPDQPLNTYYLKPVTYGVNYFVVFGHCMLKKTIRSSQYPDACRALSKYFYVDDFLGGAPTIQEALSLRDDLISVLKTAGLELGK